MRLAITGKDGKEHVIEFDSMPTDADIDEVANSFVTAKAARVAKKRAGNGDPLGDPADAPGYKAPERLAPGIRAAKEGEDPAGDPFFAADYRGDLVPGAIPAPARSGGFDLSKAYKTSAIPKGGALEMKHRAKDLDLNLGDFTGAVRRGKGGRVPLNVNRGPWDVNKPDADLREAAGIVGFGLGLMSRSAPKTGWIGEGKEKWDDPHDAAVLRNLLNPNSATFRKVMAAQRAGGGYGKDPASDPYYGASQAGAAPGVAAIVARDPGIGDATTLGLIGRSVGAALQPASTLRVLSGDARPDSELSGKEGAAYMALDALPFGGLSAVAEKGGAALAVKLGRVAAQGSRTAAGRIGAAVVENVILQGAPIIGQAADLTATNGLSFVENLSTVGGDVAAGLVKLLDPRTPFDPNATAYERAQSALMIGVFLSGGGAKAYGGYRKRALASGIDRGLVRKLEQAGRSEAMARSATVRNGNSPFGMPEAAPVETPVPKATLAGVLGEGPPKRTSGSSYDAQGNIVDAPAKARPKVDAVKPAADVPKAVETARPEAPLLTGKGKAAESKIGGNRYDPEPEPIMPAAKPKLGKKPEPVRPRTDEKPLVGPTKEMPEKFAASNAASDDLRRATSLGELPEAVQTDVTAKTAAGRYDHDGTIARARQIAKDVSEGKKAPVLSHEEQLHFGELEAEVGRRYNAAADRLSKAYESGSPTASLEADLIRAREDVDAATLANKHVGSEEARAFAARNRAYDHELSPAGVYREWTVANKEKLDPKVAAEAERIGRELEAAQKKIAEYEAGQVEKEATRRVSSRPKAQRSVEQIRQSRSDATTRMKEKWTARKKESAGRLNSVGSVAFDAISGLADIAPEIKQIAIDLADEGVLKLNEVVQKIRAIAKDEAGIDLSDEDVHNALAGTYEREKVERTPTPAQKTSAEWRKEILAKRGEERKAKAEAAKTQADEARRITLEALREARRVEAEAMKAAREENRQAAKGRKAQATELNKADAKVRAERRQQTREAFAEEREATRKAAAEAAKWERLAADAERRKARSEASQAERNRRRAFSVLKDEARKQAQAERRQAAADYERIFGERSRLEESIKTLQGKIEANEFPSGKKRVQDPELQELYIKREALRVEANARKAEIEAGARNRELGLGAKIGKQALNLPRSLVATLDASAPLNQGAFAMYAHPVMSIRAIGHMLAAARNEGALFNALGRVRTNAHYEKAVAGGLQLSAHEALSPGGDLFLSNLLGHSAEVGNLGKWGSVSLNPLSWSERAYSAYLNKIRMDMFAQMVDKAERNWGPLRGKKLSTAEHKQIADWVNVATGAGTNDIAKGLKSLNNAAPVMFAPSYMVSRWQLAFGGGGRLLRAVRTNPAVAAMIVQDYAKFAGAAGGILYALSRSGYKVDLDPRSTDFGKVKTEGDTSIDPFGGILAPIRVSSQLIAGSVRNGSKLPSNPAITLGYYGTGKASPLVRTVFNASQKEAFGKSYDPATGEGWKNIGMSMVTPIQAQSQMEMGKDRSLTTEQDIAIRILTLFGLSSQGPRGGAEK